MLELEVPTKKVAVKKSPEEVLMPKLSKFYINDRNKSSGQNGKKDGMALHLELKKAYDFSPSSSDLPNKRWVINKCLAQSVNARCSGHIPPPPPPLCTPTGTPSGRRQHQHPATP